MPIKPLKLDPARFGSLSAAFAHRQTPEGQREEAAFISEQLRHIRHKHAKSSPPSHPSHPSGTVVVSEPDPQEIASVSVRSTLNAERATRELDPYIEERRLIEPDIRELSTEIKTIRLQLEKLKIPLQDSNSRVYSSIKTQERIKRQKQKDRLDLYRLYKTVYLQKQEKIMRLRDKLQEINENMENILRKYEDTRTLAEVLKKTGGKKRRTAQRKSMKKSNSKRLNKHFKKSRRHTQT